MTVAMGNDIASYVIDSSGRPQQGRVIPVFTDKAMTTAATGLTDENGNGIAAPISLVNGVLSYNAPDGTTVHWFDRGDGKPSALKPTLYVGGGGSTVTTTTRADGAPVLVVS